MHLQWKTLPLEGHQCQPQVLKAEECASNSSKSPQWGGQAFISPQFTGCIFSPRQKPFGVTPQAHSLNLWWFLVFELHESCLSCSGACGGNISQGREHQQPQEHPFAFSISFFPTHFSPALVGRLWHFFLRRLRRQRGQNVLGHAGEGESGSRAASTVAVKN